MIQALSTWQAVGPIEAILLPITALCLVLGAALGRWRRVDTVLAVSSTVGITSLGSYAAHQRLAALPWQLSQLPERQLVGRIAQSEAQAFSVLGGALLLAALVAGSWAWRRTEPSQGPVAVAPTITASLALPVGLAGAQLPPNLPSPGDSFGMWAVGSMILVMATVLRPSHRWQLPAYAWLSGAALLAHGALARALVLDPDVGSALVALQRVQQLGLVSVALGTVVTLVALRRPLARPAVGLIAAVVPLAIQLPDQWQRHPLSPPWPATVPHPDGEPTRLAGGCLVGPGGVQVPHGLQSEVHGLRGCEQGGLHTLAATPSTPLEEIAASAGAHQEVGLLASLGSAPTGLDGWLTARWSLPVWRMREGQPEPKPVRGSWVVTQLEPPVLVGPTPARGLVEALEGQGRTELLVVPGAGTVGALASFCAVAVVIRPQGTRCGLALGDPDDWRAWAEHPPPSVEGW